MLLTLLSTRLWQQVVAFQSAVRMIGDDFLPHEVEMASPTGPAGPTGPADPTGSADPADLAGPTPQVAVVETAAKTKRGWRRLILPAILVVAAGGIAIWFVMHAGLESTDDAQLEATIVPLPARASGTIVAVHFSDNERVHKGDLLAEIDDAPAAAAVAQAEANVAAAEAQARAADAAAAVAETTARSGKAVAEAGLTTASSASRAREVQIREGRAAVKTAQVALGQARANLSRDEALFADGALAKARLEVTQTAAEVARSHLVAAQARVAGLEASAATATAQIGEASARVDQSSDVDTQVALAKAKADAAHAQVDVARAARDLAKLNLEHTRVYAPEAGVLSDKGIAVGQMVVQGQPIAQLVTDDLWVVANYKETDLTHMKVGQPADIEVDAFSDATLHGHIQSFSAATGARFALLPPDNATGNFTKVVQRLPVRIELDELPKDVSLSPGLSVIVTVDTRATHKR